MDYDITIGRFRVSTLERIAITRSAANLADTATITLPGAACNRALEVESKIAEGDAVCIRFGYDAHLQELPVEFEGYVVCISTDDDSIRIECEDAIYRFRRELKDAAFESVSVGELLRHVVDELGDLDLACDCDFRYDRFTLYGTTGFELLKKLQEETRAAIYLQGRTLHVHRPYEATGRKTVCDFAVNIEKSELKYGDAGYEGSFTGWLLPRIEPTDLVELRDAEYAYKAGTYYVVSVVTTFDETGGRRKVTLGKKME